MTSLRRFMLALIAISLVSSGICSAQVRSGRGKTPTVINSRSRFFGKSLESPKSRLAKRRAQVASAADTVLQPTGGLPNDECTGALPFNQDFDGNPIAGNSTTTITTLPALTDPVDVSGATTNTSTDPASSCQADGSRSVWYTFTPPSDGQYFISSCADAPTRTTVIDPIISIYTSSGGCGAAANFTEVPTQGTAGSTGATDGCDDDSCFTEAQAVVQTQLTGGTTYYVVVRQFGNTAPNAGESTLQLRASRATGGGIRIAQPGEVLISEFRLSGNGNQRDEYVELYNNTNVPLNIGDIYGVASFDPALVGVGTPGDGIFVVGISPGVVIPPRGFYLVTNNFGNAYSLGNNYPGNNRRTDFDGDYFLDNRGLAFVRLESNNNLTTIDAVGFGSDSQGNSSYAGATGNTSPNGFVEGTAITYNGSGTGGAIASQASFVRRLVGAIPVDSGNNANDFVLVSTAGPNAGLTGLNLTSNPAGTAILGAPNPQNLQAPYRGTSNPIQVQLVDQSVGGNTSPNRDRYTGEVGPAASVGTLAFRRRFTNTGNRDVTSLRFRFVNITTLGSPNQVGGGNQADGRALSSPGGGRVTVTRADGTSVRIANLRLDPPSDEGSNGLGGGLYSSVSVPFPTTLEGSMTVDRIAPGQSVVLEFLFGINNATSGTFRYATVIEINQPAR